MNMQEVKKNNITRYKSTKSLTSDNRLDIKRLFYRGLREGEAVVDNSSKAISEELNLPIGQVQWYISTKL